MSHSQIATDNCSQVSLTVDRCSFSIDLASQPVYRPAIVLAGCRNIHLDVTNSGFTTTPILVDAELNR